MREDTTGLPRVLNHQKEQHRRRTWELPGLFIHPYIIHLLLEFDPLNVQRRHGTPGDGLAIILGRRPDLDGPGRHMSAAEQVQIRRQNKPGVPQVKGGGMGAMGAGGE